MGEGTGRGIRWGNLRVRSWRLKVRARFCTLSPGLPHGLEELLERLLPSAAAAALFIERSCPGITPLAGMEEEEVEEEST